MRQKLTKDEMTIPVQIKGGPGSGRHAGGSEKPHEVIRQTAEAVNAANRTHSVVLKETYRRAASAMSDAAIHESTRAHIDNTPNQHLRAASAHVDAALARAHSSVADSIRSHYGPSS